MRNKKQLLIEQLGQKLENFKKLRNGTGINQGLDIHYSDHF